MVFAEATSVLPLIASDAYHRNNWKNRKKENFQKFLKLDELFISKKGFLGYEANSKIDNKVVIVPFGLRKNCKLWWRHKKWSERNH